MIFGHSTTSHGLNFSNNTFLECGFVGGTLSRVTSLKTCICPSVDNLTFIPGQIYAVAFNRGGTKPLSPLCVQTARSLLEQ